MSIRRASILALLPLLLLTACAGVGGGGDDASLTAMPVEPADHILHQTVASYLDATSSPKNSQYEYTRIDLNGDGLRDGLVLFNLPHTYWCGWSGCTMAVFEAGEKGFRLVSQTSRIRGPVVVGSTRTNGWDDIGVRLSGLDSRDRNVLLKFDGAAYPANPVTEEQLPYDLAALNGVRVFP